MSRVLKSDVTKGCRATKYQSLQNYLFFKKAATPVACPPHANAQLSEMIVLQSSDTLTMPLQRNQKEGISIRAPIHQICLQKQQPRPGTYYMQAFGTLGLGEGIV
jgi:hypothetical protein